MSAVALSLCFPGDQSAAQGGPPAAGLGGVEEHPILGVRTGNLTFADSLVRKRCPSLVMNDRLAADYEREARAASIRLRSWCTVDTARALPNADGTTWMMAVYVHNYASPADSTRRRLLNSTLDTTSFVTAVLYSRRGPDQSWRAEWAATVERDITWSVDVETAARADQSMLATMRFCINGTGGCWQRYLHRTNGKWTAVEERFWQQIPAIGNGRIGKGAGVDVAKLTGSYGIYADTDGNCCPSRELLLTLDLRGDTLVLVNHTIRAVRQD